MKLYAALARLFPRSFTAKLFFIAFLGTHVPLLATVAYLMRAKGGLGANLELTVMMVLATLVGTIATLSALALVLRPLYRVRDALQAYEERRERIALPTGFLDELGQLIDMADRMMADVGRELTEQRTAADTDPLTGALNRRGFGRAAAGRVQGAVIYCDLDHFKEVNDRFGHDVGDAVLCDAVAIMSAILRRTDLLARLGGEEFVIFLPQADTVLARRVADRIRQTFEARLRAGDRTVTGSFGVTRRDPDEEMEEAMTRADGAVYAAKREGRNRVTVVAGLTGAGRAAA